MIEATIRIVRRLRWTTVLVRGQDDLTRPAQYTVSDAVATLAARPVRSRCATPSTVSSGPAG
ncbi:MULTISPECIES: hypothetical protein [Saccharothrix]|uniref:hypothetical protein n=1 Tax=Saccharothrix TaxID=2071 RepID=UPI0011611546|nr:hypothetical protein [Saccharothrix sp. CB00851]